MARHRPDRALGGSDPCASENEAEAVDQRHGGGEEPGLWVGGEERPRGDEERPRQGVDELAGEFLIAFGFGLGLRERGEGGRKGAVSGRERREREKEERERRNERKQRKEGRKEKEVSLTWSSHPLVATMSKNFTRA